MSCDDNAPQPYKEAQGVAEWEAAMHEEIKALHQNNTLELVPKPNEVELITCKWIFKLKKKVDGTVDRYKACLVAYGFSQQYDLYYEEIFSPVDKMVTIRTIISLAAYNRWNLWQLDVKNAFFFMVSWIVQSLWSSPKALFHLSFLIMCADSIRPYTVSSKLHVPGMVKLRNTFLFLTFILRAHILVYLSRSLLPCTTFFFFMWMI